MWEKSGVGMLGLVWGSLRLQGPRLRPPVYFIILVHGFYLSGHLMDKVAARALVTLF